MDPREKLVQSVARLAEIDLQIENFKKRRTALSNYISRLKGELGQKNLPIDTPQKVNYSDEFNEDWKTYAEGTGHRVEKKAAFTAWKRVSPSDRKQLLKRAISNYLGSREVKRGFGKHFKRFLREDYWIAWVDKSPERETDNEKESADEVARGILNGRG